MLKKLFYALVCVPLGLVCGGAKATETADAKTAYDFSFTSITGEPLPLSQFKGKPILVVNTASECGFTSQYKELEELWEKYKERGLVVIAVPSNDFGGQEPGSAETIKEFCEVKFGVSFYLTEKYHVKGDEAHPFYKHAREKLGALAAPKWNFHKYLIAPDGQVTDWYASTTSPMDKRVQEKIESLFPG
ncbi:MAG: glutathione peroxidase [Alphaproteobacteria bacterium]|nr:glutathione peroxidase [Alphaproteobacteria bacterium]